MNNKVGVIGLGYVGLPLLAALAEVGCEVVGLDSDQRKVESLRRTLEADIYEPGVTDLLQRYSHHIEFISSYEELMRDCDIIVITVGTPLGPNATAKLGYVTEVATTLGRHLRQGQTIILKSTVPPGTTRELALLMERISGLRAGEDFYVAFCPERIAEGMALHEFYSLPKVVGGINCESTERAERLMRRLGGKVLRVSSSEVAEVAKLVDNCYRVVNIAFANEIGQVCEQLGIDAYEVRSACNDGYPRTNLFQAGLGAGGSCLCKDPQVFVHYAEKVGIQPGLMKASISANREATLRPALLASQFIRNAGIQKPKFSFLGLAFKGFPETDDIRDSPAVDICRQLNREFPEAEFAFHDPLVKEFQGHPVCPTLEECVRGSYVVMFLTNHRALLNVDVRDILRHSNVPLLILDCWHNVANLAEAKGKDVEIVRIGDGTL
jgi:UDP-N-acetyl-D-mannosaminuronic acid dehydrogenase